MPRGLPTLALVALAALLATLPAVDGAFVYDDHAYLVQNPAVSGDASVWTTPLGEARQALWRPLTVLSWRLQWAAPDRATPVLAGNVALHVLASVLVWLVARRLGGGGPAAGVAALLFAVHPVHAEAVAWSSGRAEVLATVFVLAAWWAHLAPGRGAIGLSLAAFLCAALSKENALVAPALFLLADLACGRRPLPVRRLLLLGSVAASVFALRLLVLPQALPADGPYLATPFGGRLVVALDVLGKAVRLLLWPHPLRVEYARDEFLVLQPEAALAAALLALAVAVWSRERRLALGLLLVPLALLPVLHLVPIGEPFAERFLYLPSVGICLAAGSGIAWLGRRELRGGRGLGVSIALVLGALVLAIPASRSAVSVFHDDLSLWSHAARVAPQLPLVQYNLGSRLHDAGRHETVDRDSPGCRQALTASLELEPRHAFAAFAHQVLAAHALGADVGGPPDPWGAALHFRAAMELLPGLPEPRLALAEIALQSSGIVDRREAQALLAPLVDHPSLPEPLRRAAQDLLGQLSAPPSAPGDATGTSSADKS